MSTTGQYTPFLNSKADSEVFRKYYSDAKFCRVLLHRSSYWKSFVRSDQLWIDSGFDGLSQEPLPESDWAKHVAQYGNLDFMRAAAFVDKPDEKQLRPIVERMLDECMHHGPAYLSVPQWPHEDGTRYNKINRVLASLAADWRTRRQCKAKFILPLIFTNQNQLTGRTERAPKVKISAALMERSKADGYWSVDSSLDDQKGTGNFDMRFAGIIKFYEELAEVVSADIRVGGPYWGLNIVLWARGLITNYGIGIGSSFNYHITGGFSRAGRPRVAISCLRRWVLASNELNIWLQDAAAKLPVGSTERLELERLRIELPRLVGDAAKRQIAHVYKDWLSKIETVAAPGRGLALYQDLSSAFVTGRNLPELPAEEGTARRPEKVAQQLMLHCL